MSIDQRPRRPLLLGPLVAITLIAGALGAAAPAHAAAPATPVLVAPADGSTTAGAVPRLQVSASDPDGGQVEVTFQGRRAGTGTTDPGTGAPFTLVALPDTQNYTYGGRQATIAAQANWAVNTRAGLNTAFVAHLGDLVSNYPNATQWGHVSNGLRPLDQAGVPNSVIPGNHDFDNATGEVGPYDTYFPVSRYRDATWTPSTAKYGGYLGQNQFGTDPVDRRNMDNYALFTAGGRDFLVLNLEWEAPAYALAWADRVLAAHPGRTVIMTTHSFVTVSGGRRSVAERPGGTAPSQIWTDFVSTHCQVRLVLSGHEHNGDDGEARRTDNNSCGQPVHQILTDYQDRANGGNGWLRYYTFDPAANTMAATTYSPTLQTYETDANSAFTLPFDLGPVTPTPFTTIGTATVASGGTASIDWTGLTADADYEWRAVASDGTSTTTSPTWRLHTPSPAAGIDDTFTRTVTTGWGRADTGQEWSLSGSAAQFAVDGGVGRITVPKGSSRAARLPDLGVRDATVTADVAASGAGGSGAYTWLQARVNQTNSYRAKLRLEAGGATSLALTRTINGTETQIAAPVGLGTIAGGTPLRMVLQVSGASPTTVRAKVWPVGGTAPTAWTVSTTDATAALQTAGGAGLETYQSSGAAGAVSVAVDRFTVTDDAAPPPTNLAPTAVIGTPVVDGRSVALSGADSNDTDGTIVSYSWDFGDGTARGSGASVSHTYAADGSYQVELTVTDDDGATATTRRPVTVEAPNRPPTADIATPSVNGRSVTLSGAGSTDVDGTIVAYSWDFGDGTARGSGASVSHTYAADGSYQVELTVTDDDGATASARRTVTVSAPVDPRLGADAFERAVANGWGNADLGGSWSLVGAANRFAVAQGRGQVKYPNPGTGAETRLGIAASTATRLGFSVSWDQAPSTGTLYAYGVVRAVSSNSDYRLKVSVGTNGRPTLELVRKLNGTETTLARTTLTGLTVAAGQAYRVAVDAVSGTDRTTLRASMWAVGGTEPASAQVSATDTTPALQGAGSVGLGGYRSSATTNPLTISFDDVDIRSLNP